MKPDDEVIYVISITGIKTPSNQKAITDDLPKHVGAAKMNITPAVPSAPGQVAIPRLFTRWRGNAEEQAWQNALMGAVKAHNASIAIDVSAWDHAPGYPQGDTEL